MGGRIPHDTPNRKIAAGIVGRDNLISAAVLHQNRRNGSRNRTFRIVARDNDRHQGQWVGEPRRSLPLQQSYRSGMLSSRISDMCALHCITNFD